MTEEALQQAEQEETPDKSTEEDTDEQPAIEDDEFADVDLDSIAEDVEEEAGMDVDDGTAEEAEEAAEAPAGGSGTSWGEMYVGTLTTMSNAVIEEYGKDDAEPIDEDLAYQLRLDEYMDEWMAKHGKAENMPPEKALAVFTGVFLLTVVGTKTELPSELLAEVDI